MYYMNDITRDGEPVLRQVSEKIEFPLTKKDLQLAHDMMEYLYNSQDPKIGKEMGLRAGVGLAAPQVGVGRQMIALLVPKLDPNAYADDFDLEKVMVNPKIVSHSAEKICLKEGEGCLSVDDDVPGYVPRYARITVTYQDIQGNSYKNRFKGYPAIVLQHEIDHLNGHLYYNRINHESPFTLGDLTYLLGEEY